MRRGSVEDDRLIEQILALPTAAGVPEFPLQATAVP
jgi:hypothetical protein